ncbi:MAG: hypothetical protein Hyperionvirus2_101 [Hyperionvirus sp.]|uniref:Uncharacterized protein n=1 Tax=Hyperionvirus sp. TaxID=2487770 RepID=A0A3G5AA47_9VIRU|nr:MAG: hypothetical protein Hyperionvirus2_101 [Hyperionvirus sp.]
MNYEDKYRKYKSKYLKKKRKMNREIIAENDKMYDTKYWYPWEDLNDLLTFRNASVEISFLDEKQRNQFFFIYTVPNGDHFILLSVDQNFTLFDESFEAIGIHLYKDLSQRFVYFDVGGKKYYLIRFERKETDKLIAFIANDILKKYFIPEKDVKLTIILGKDSETVQKALNSAEDLFEKDMIKLLPYFNDLRKNIKN